MSNHISNPFDTPSDALAHYGVLGMKWGVRKDRGGSQKKPGLKERIQDYSDKVYEGSPGSAKTSVTAKNGDVLSVEKERPGKLYLAVAKLQNREPEANLSAMVIKDKTGEKVGSFQIWREGPSVVRGEWLEIEASKQGRGYSEASIRGLISAAKKDPKLKEVRLQVPANAAPAKHIYTKIGFTKDKDLGDPGDGVNIEDWVYKVR